MDRIPSAEVKEVQNILDVLHETSVEIYESKKAAIAAGDEVLAAQIGRGKDIMSILRKSQHNYNVHITDFLSSFAQSEPICKRTRMIGLLKKSLWDK